MTATEVTTHASDNEISHEEHRALFEHCTGMSPADLRMLYDSDIYIGDENIYHNPSPVKFVAVYARCSTFSESGYAFHARGSVKRNDFARILTKKCEVVNIPEDMYVEQEQYEDVVEMRRDSRIVKVFKMKSRYFAFLDECGGIFFVDFIHYGYDYSKAFRFVLEAAWGKADYDSIAMTKVRNALNFIAPEKLKRIEVEVEFDKEAYMEQVTKKTLATINMFRKAAESKSRVLTRKLETEKVAYKKRLEGSQLASFISGITAMKNNDWEIKKGRLRYSKKIVAKYISKNGVTINTDCDTFYVTGLSLTVTPHPSSAKFEKAYHSNVSASQVCIGDLSGCTLAEIMEKLPKALETCSLNSPYGGAATELAKKILVRDPEAAKVGSKGNKWETDNKVTKKERAQREHDAVVIAASRRGDWSTGDDSAPTPSRRRRVTTTTAL
jgi:hypothetical protein